jgi:uncharacterized membrane protein
MPEPPNKSSLTERRLETVVGNLLRIGVLIAAAVVFLGAVVFLSRHGAEPRPNYLFHGESSDLRSVRGIVADVFLWKGRGLIQLGLLLLIATPVMRVVLLAVGFARERDLLYTLVSLAVLAILLYSLFGRPV